MPYEIFIDLTSLRVEMGDRSTRFNHWVAKDKEET